jgi:N-acetyltransferase
MMDPPMQPTLSDDVVILRPLVADDWTALFAVASDPEIWAIHPAHDRWQEPVFRTYFDESVASNGGLLALDRATGAVIGASRYDIRVCLEGEVEIGWTFLARSHWGGTYNHAIKRLMLAEAFAKGYHTAVFLVAETNLRSRAAMTRIGGRLTDRCFSWDMAGVDVNHLIYAITREDFAAGPLAL